MLTQDIQAPFDPTAYASVNGAQILQLITGASPANDKGMFILTTDVAGVPQVPNATTTTKWQNYGWIRKSATGATLYIWNPVAPNDPTLMYWQSVSVTNLGVGSVTTNNIADNAVIDQKIASVSWGKIINPPSGLPPSGVAGGDLTGNYPAPTIAAGAVTSAKIAAATVTSDKIATGANNGVGVGNIVPNNVNGTIIATIAGVVQWIVSAIATSANVNLTTAKSIPVVKGDNSDFQMLSIKSVLQDATVFFTQAGINLASGSTILNAAHGLGATPSYVRGVIVCATAENGYAVGDEVSMDAVVYSNFANANETFLPAFAVGANNANVFIAQSNTSGVGATAISPFIMNKGTGAFSALTLAHWTAKIYARL